MRSLTTTVILLLMVVFIDSCSRKPPSNPVASATATATPQVESLVTSQASKQTATEQRDLSMYDFGGRHGCTTPFIRESRRCEASLKNARNFIWNHWQQKRRAYIIVTGASVDAASKTHIFIEPDEGGAWHVVCRSETIYAVSAPDERPGDIQSGPDVRSIAWRRAQAPAIELRPGTRFLVLLDAKGEQVGWL